MLKKRYLTMIMLGAVVTALLGGCSTNQSLSPSNTSLEPAQQTELQVDSLEENELYDGSNQAVNSDVQTRQDVEDVPPLEIGADGGTAETDSGKGEVASDPVKGISGSVPKVEKPSSLADSSSSSQQNDAQKPPADSSTQKPQSSTGNPRGANEKSQSNNTTKEVADSSKTFVIDDYMTMNDSLETFTAFVNRRKDFSAEEKKKIIDARSRQLEITTELMKEYKAILTKEEMEAYLVQPVGEALEAGILPANDTYDSAIKKIEEAKKNNSEISGLTKQLKEVQGGLLRTFTDKVEKEKSKLLGF